MNINIRILDHLITLFEIDQVVAEKTKAVRDQRFADAATILEQQRALEQRLLTVEELKELRTEVYRLQSIDNTQTPEEGKGGEV